MKKDARIHFVVEPSKKEEWLKKAKEYNMTLTEYITHKVEDNLSKKEVKGIITFIENSTNTDSKVENNINQIAKWVNTHHQITDEKMNEYLFLLKDISRKIADRNTIFKKIILLMSNL